VHVLNPATWNQSSFSLVCRYTTTFTALMRYDGGYTSMYMAHPQNIHYFILVRLSKASVTCRWLTICTDHCIDMLRLSSQCQSDLTPMLYYNLNGTMGIQPHVHTCRDFDQIHQWAVSRSRCGDDEECAISLGKQVGGEM
jgi:hypothetical protein